MTKVTSVATTSAVPAVPPIDALEQELTTLAGHLNAGNYCFLQLLAEFDRRRGHAGWGHRFLRPLAAVEVRHRPGRRARQSTRGARPRWLAEAQRCHAPRSAQLLQAKILAASS